MVVVAQGCLILQATPVALSYFLAMTLKQILMGSWMALFHQYVAFLVINLAVYWTNISINKWSHFR